MSGVSSGIYAELLILGRACLIGVCMVAVYDLIRIFRRIVPHGILWISLEDILFWLTAALVEFFMLYRENNGVIRAYIIGGSAVGALVYYLLFSRLLMRVVSALILKIKKQLKKIRKAVTIWLSKGNE